MNSAAFPLAVELTLLPEAGFRRATEILSPIFRQYSPVIDLTEDEERDLSLSMIEADNGDFTSDTEVAAAFREIHAAVGI